MKTEVVLKLPSTVKLKDCEVFNENRSCIEIEIFDPKSKTTSCLMKTEVVLKLGGRKEEELWPRFNENRSCIEIN